MQAPRRIIRWKIFQILLWLMQNYCTGRRWHPGMERMYLWSRQKISQRAKRLFFVFHTRYGALYLFTADEIPKVIASIDFDSTYNVSAAVTDFRERDFTDTEREIFDFRSKALDVINNDTFFLHYKNTNYNIIPVVVHGEKRVYITGTTQNGEVIFGNDYLLCFDAKNNLTVKKDCTTALYERVLANRRMYRR